MIHFTICLRGRSPFVRMCVSFVWVRAEIAIHTGEYNSRTVKNVEFKLIVLL